MSHVDSSETLSAAPPSNRPTWSGLLQLSLVGIPVKAYPAVRTTEAGHFHLLHADCGQRIRYAKQCPLHGTIDSAAIVRGFAYAPDRHVVLDPAELDALRPPRDRALRLERFLEPSHLDPALFSGRSLYLVPDGLAAQRGYEVLRDTMQARQRWALGRVVLGGHRQVVLLRPASTLVMHGLAELCAKLEMPELAVAPGTVGAGRAFFAAAVAGGHEGIVAKRLDSPYCPGRRSHAWHKIKPRPVAQKARDPRR